jgi:hypothetical protein
LKQNRTALIRLFLLAFCVLCSGAEGVNTGGVKYKDFVLVNNEKAGYEGKLLLQSPQYDSDNPVLKNCIIVANDPALSRTSAASAGTRSGVVLPYGSGWYARGIHWYNFDGETSALAFTRIDGHCAHFCGGYNYQFAEVSFTDSPNIARFEWTHEGVLWDMDGSLTGSPGYTITPTNGNLPTGQ